MSNLEELAKEGPYTSRTHGENGVIDAEVMISDIADTLSEAEIQALSYDDIHALVVEWVSGGEAARFLPTIPWEIKDERFTHANSVTDVVVDDVHIGDLDNRSVYLDVELHETKKGFQWRLVEEDVAAG